MTTTRSFDRELEAFLAAEAPMTAPAGLHDDAISRAGHTRQRPAWLVGLRGESYGRRPIVGARPMRAVSLLLAIAVLVVALAAGIAVGALLSEPPRPAGRNGDIAYSVFENGIQTRSQTSSLYVLGLDGETRRLGRGACPTYALDGRWLVYRSDWISSEVVVEAADGSSRTVVLTEDDSIHPSRRPYALSPDGSQLAWIKPLADYSFDLPDGTSEGGVATNELWVSPVSGGPAARIVAGSSVPNETYWEPAWSPDGSRLAIQSFQSLPSAQGTRRRTGVYVVDADGSDLHRISTRQASASGAGLAWSPDGRSLAYLGMPDGVALPSAAPDDPGYGDPALDVFVVGADGSNERNVTDSTAFERRPRWSPDGSRLAYETSDDGESYRLAIAATDGAELTVAPRIGPASDGYAWAPDGSRLVSVLGNELRTVDADLQGRLVTVLHVESDDPAFRWGIETECAPVWQRLEP